MSSFRFQMNDDTPDEKAQLAEKIGAYSHLGMRKEALDESKKLIGVAPDDPASFVELGLSLQENGEIEKAIKCYQSAIDKFPRYSKLYTNLGYCYEKYMKRNDLAVVCYEKAVQLNPDDEWALNNTGVMFQRLGNGKQAFCYYKKACEAAQEKYGYVELHLLHNFAWGYYLCHEYKSANFIFYQLESDKGYDPLYWADFGCVKYKMGLYNDALSFFEKAIRIQPKRRRFQGLYKLASRKVCK
jgi:tetratricopeptide (TPR) repeat protein